MTSTIWLAVAATTVAIGSVWQMVVAAMAGIESMDSFLGAQNAILREERARVRREVPRWQVSKRRREIKRANQNARAVLTTDELKLDSAYDRQAIGWAFVVGGALVAAIVSWVASVPI